LNLQVVLPVLEGKAEMFYPHKGGFMIISLKTYFL